MLTLVTLPPAFGLRNISPFCLKVEMALTHLGVPFEHVLEQDPRTLDLHGLGRHTLEGQKAFARRDLEALAGALSAGSYIVGDRLTVYDFVIAGMLSGFMDNKPDTWMSEMANGFTVLRDYLERIQQEVGVHG